MTPEQWQQIKQLFHAALGIDPAHRDQFLAEACAGDEGLMREVQSLLESGEKAAAFIEKPAAALLAGSLAENIAASSEPVRFGPYQVVGEIGHGGMGAVYRAMRTDGEYRKAVAIKLVRQGVDSDDMRRRFMSERQILANLDHPNIARLLDGGTTEGGLPFIVMEYVDGTPIDAYCDAAGLPTRARLNVFLHVCRAVDYAHRNLVIHRDIKPGNILVSRDGAPKLLDFGIAKLLSPDPLSTAPEQTVTAMRMMTPEFASPEQVRGERVTTAGDVYSLGVVLYVLLTGHRPYRVTTGAPEEIIRAVCDQDPLRPSSVITKTETEKRGEATVQITPDTVSRTRDGDILKLRRALRGDLDNILLVAMQKEPDRRYGSVGALAADIERYLDGEPVQARASTWAYLLGKKVRKHPVSVAASILALITILALGGMWLRARWQTFAQVQVAQQFTQDAERIELILRSVYLSPLHDTRQERDELRQRMKAMETRVQQADETGKVFGECALGRALLAFEDYEGARRHLEAAWRSGYRSPDAACALGLTLVRLYQKEKGEVDAIRNQERREAKLKQLLATYRDPALEYLRAGEHAEIVTPEYVMGVIAYLENRYADCLKKAQEAIEKVPWYYEAKILEGDAYLEQANQKRNSGDCDGAMSTYEMADKVYREAGRIGESDPRTYARIANVWKLAMFSELYGPSRDMAELLRRTTAAAEDALRADPDNADVHVLLSNAYRMFGEYELRSGQDPTEWIEKSVADAELALRGNPTDSTTYASIGAAYVLMGQFESEHGRDPMPTFDRAVDCLEHASRLGPTNDTAIMNLANCYRAKAEFQLGHGQDPRKALKAGIRNLERAIELFPMFANIYNNLGNCNQDLGLWEMAHGGNPTTSFDSAVRAHRKALELNPKHAFADGNLGNDYASIARYRMSCGQDPLEYFQLARKQYQDSLRLTPDDSIDFANMGDALKDQARYEIWSGVNPGRTIREAMVCLETAIKSKPDFGILYTMMSGACLAGAHFDLEQQRSPQERLDRARADSRKGASLDPMSGSASRAVAEVELLEARWLLRRRLSPSTPLGRALERLQEAVKLEPNEAENFRAMGELHRLRAEWALGQKADSADAQAEISRGLDIVKRALSINPRDAEAAALEGELCLQKARIESVPAQKADWALKAQRALEKSLEMNRYVGHEHASSLAAARDMAAGPKRAEPR